MYQSLCTDADAVCRCFSIRARQCDRRGVWVVGDEAILKSDVENERLNAQYEGRKFDGDPYCIIPEQLAIQKLFLHQAAIDSIEVSEQELSVMWKDVQIG